MISLYYQHNQENMKKSNQENTGKAKKFIQIPKYPGGKEAFQKFIKEHLKYPEEAIKNKIEGTVFLAYHVDGLGNILDVSVEKGIGYGCDEEAVRVIRLLKYDKAKNRGLRVTATMRTRINFDLRMVQAQLTIQYQVGKKEEPKKETPKKPDGGGYGYTINY